MKDVDVGDGMMRMFHDKKSFKITVDVLWVKLKGDDWSIFRILGFLKFDQKWEKIDEIF